MDIVVKPVAVVSNSRHDLSDDFWGTVISEIELLPGIPQEALDGIEEFSHLEVLFHFNRADAGKAVFSGHPRGNPNWPKVGIFAQRKKDRPNALGLTVVEFVRREKNKIWVKYLDAIDGTPILDIKPVLTEFLPGKPVRQPAWCTELMKEYWS